MDHHNMCRFETVLSSNLRTYERTDQFDLYEVICESSDGTGFSVRVNTTDYGIAAVEAYLFLKRYNPAQEYRVKSMQYSPPGSSSRYDPELPDAASDYLISNCLREENKVLIACYISICNDDIHGIGTAAIERELQEWVLSCDKGYGAGLSTEEIKNRCSHIWKSYLFCERVNFSYDGLTDFRRLERNVHNPEELLFWTFMMSFYGQYDCNYPYTLFMGIKNCAFEPYLSGSPYCALIGSIMGECK